jgi:neutral ceramidase
MPGCGIKITVPRYNIVPPKASDVFLAGAGKVDITPPPGYPMGGHSIGGKMARGYWTRLYARAFYFQNASGQRLILVSCDLFAISAGVYAQVAEELKIAPESLIVAATHTHQGPAGFMSSAVFNFGGPLPGYDFELAKRIKDGIEEAINSAIENAREAGANKLVLRSGFAPNLQRNRAIDAFYRNPSGPNGPDYVGQVLMASKAAGMTCPGLDSGNDCPRYQAADPALKVLEVLRGERRIALLVFYAIHNTAMSHDATLYQSDLSGYAMHELEQVNGNEPAVVAGFFNGAEGDISPRWVAQDRSDVIGFGGKLADAVKAILRNETGTQLDTEISGARQEFTAVPASNLTRRLTLPGSGVGELGGAEDGRTMLYAYGWHGGVTIGGSDAKMPALSLHNIALLKILQPILASPKSYPQKIPVSTASLGVFSMAAIPTEMTTVQGLQLRQALEKEMHKKYVVIGLANEYIGYTATEEEYKAQDYEGGSTMYGPAQGKVIGDLLVQVAKTQVARSKDQPSGQVKEERYDMGAKWPYHFGPEFFGERYNLPYEDLEPMMPDAERRPDDGTPRFEWTEAKETDWETRNRHVKILRQDPDGWKLAYDDLGVSILTVLVDGKSDPNFRLWTAIWAPSNLKPAERAATYMFWVERPAAPAPLAPAKASAKTLVTPPAPPPICSKGFHLGAPVIKIPMDPQEHAAACPAWSEK